MKGIGGSDASAVLGLNPYMSNIDLWEIKTGRKIPKDISNVSYVKYGNEAEAPLRELFKLDFPQYEVEHKENTVVVHPEHDFLRCSLDGKLIDRDTGEVGVLEVKTTDILSSMHQEKWENDRIPDNYYIQVIHCMMVIGASFAILKAQLKTRYKDEVRLNIRHYRIDINEGDVKQDIEDLKRKEIKFWNEYVLKDKQPPRELPV